MLNLFTKNTEQASNDAEKSTPDQFKNAVNNNSAVETETKKVHGENGVCCGSCGGE